MSLPPNNSPAGNAEVVCKCEGRVFTTSNFLNHAQFFFDQALKTKFSTQVSKQFKAFTGFSTSATATPNDVGDPQILLLRSVKKPYVFVKSTKQIRANPGNTANPYELVVNIHTMDKKGAFWQQFDRTDRYNIDPNTCHLKLTSSIIPQIDHSTVTTQYTPQTMAPQYTGFPLGMKPN